MFYQQYGAIRPNLYKRFPSVEMESVVRLVKPCFIFSALRRTYNRRSRGSRVMTRDVCKLPYKAA